MMERKIIHLDLDAFYCAVEELHNPSLTGKPFAVGGRPESRGVVSACSYAARQLGVRSAMPMARALKLCPGLIILPGRYQAYRELSQKVMDRLSALTPLVEQISIDEAFFDVSDLSEPAAEIAGRIQAEIRDELGLPCSLGVATNKLVAKIATDTGKAAHRSPVPPNAITIVPPGEEAAFLAPLPTIALWGIGPKTAEKLSRLDIQTIGDIASRSEQDLAQVFGRTGAEMVLRARGIDDSPIVVQHEMKSISQEITFARDIAHPAVLLETLRDLSRRVGSRLRKAKLCGSTVKLKLRWQDFTTLSRQSSLSYPTDQDEVIFALVEQLFTKTWKPGKPVRLLGVGVSGLAPPPRQLSLWESPDRPEENFYDETE